MAEPTLIELIKLYGDARADSAIDKRVNSVPAALAAIEQRLATAEALGDFDAKYEVMDILDGRDG